MSYSDRKNFGNKEAFGLGCSFAVHLSIVGLFMFGAWGMPEVVARPVTSNLMMFDFSMAKVMGDKHVVKLKPTTQPPAITVNPAELEQKSKKPVKLIPAPDSKSVTEVIDTAPAGSLGTVFIWTPPAPSPEASLIGSGIAPGLVRPRSVLPVVEVGAGASDAILKSFDQGLYEDAALVQATEHLDFGGTIRMSVTVDATGNVSDCVVASTSGSVELDAKACLLVRSYLYRPAQDARGHPYVSIVAEVIEWTKDGQFGPALAVTPVNLAGKGMLMPHVVVGDKIP